MRLAALHQGSDLSGLTREGVSIAVRDLEVAAHASLQELAPGMQAAARTIRVVIHIMDGANAALLLDQSATVQDAQVVCNQFAVSVKQDLGDLLATQEGILDDASKQARFLRVFPAGLGAFSTPLDDKRPAGCVAVSIATDCVEWLRSVLERGEGTTRGQIMTVTALSGEYETKVTYGVAIPVKYGNREIPSGMIVRALFKQLGRRIVVYFKKDRHPGTRLYGSDLTDAEAEYIMGPGGGGVKIFGKIYPLMREKPTEETINFFVYSPMLPNLKVVREDLIPELCGFLTAKGGGCLPEEVEVSKVGGGIVDRNFDIFRVAAPHSMENYDAITGLTTDKVFRAFNPRQPTRPAYPVKVTGNLEEMQLILNARVMKAPVNLAEDGEDDDGPLPEILGPTDVTVTPAALRALRV